MDEVKVVTVEKGTEPAAQFGFDRTYIPSGHAGLCEKYGWRALTGISGFRYI